MVRVTNHILFFQNRFVDTNRGGNKDYLLDNPCHSGGPERIRTAVEAFAELCLSHSATGPYF